MYNKLVLGAANKRDLVVVRMSGLIKCHHGYDVEGKAFSLFLGSMYDIVKTEYCIKIDK